MTAAFLYIFQKKKDFIKEKNMLHYCIKKLLTLIPVLIGISLTAFILGKCSPGDPAIEALRRIAIEDPTMQQIEEMRQEMGLNRPISVQYLSWLGDVLKGDMGESYLDHTSVSEELARRLPVTLKLSLLALLWTVILGIGAGVCMSWKPEGILDKFLSFLAILLLSIPGFWLALFAIIIFAEILQIFPTSGISSWKSYIMPSFVLAASNIGVTARLSRAALKKEMGQQYVLVAYSKGLNRKKVLMTHAFRNSLIPVITVIGNYFGGILGGSAIVESIFALPGIGKYALDAIYTRDYLVIQGYVLFTGAVFVLVTLMIDLLYVLVNPKIRLGEEKLWK